MDTQNDTAPDRGSGSSSYPQGCTDNGLLMRGLQRLTAAGKPQVFVLYTALVVRAMGKGHCWPSDELLMGETGASRRTIERWRAILVTVGLITTQDRGASGLFYVLTDTSVHYPATSGGMAESRHIRRDYPATSGGIIPPHLAAPLEKKRSEEEEGGTAPSPSQNRNRNPEDPAAVLAVLLSWDWTEDQIAGALWSTGYKLDEAVRHVHKAGIWKPYNNRTNTGSTAEEFKKLLMAVERAQKSLNKRSAGTPAAVTAPEERTEPVASDQAQHAEDVTVLPDFAHADPADPAAVEVEANPPPDELKLVQDAGGYAVDIVMAKASGRPFDLHKLLAELEAKRSATASRPEPAAAPTPAAEDDAQPPAIETADAEPTAAEVTVSAPALDHATDATDGPTGQAQPERPQGAAFEEELRGALTLAELDALLRGKLGELAAIGAVEDVPARLLFRY